MKAVLANQIASFSWIKNKSYYSGVLTAWRGPWHYISGQFHNIDKIKLKKLSKIFMKKYMIVTDNDVKYNDVKYNENEPWT